MDGSGVARHAAPMVPFRCPICRCSQYILRGQSKSGARVHECNGCTVLFSDPVKFTRFEPFPPTADPRHQGELPPFVHPRSTQHHQTAPAAAPPPDSDLPPRPPPQ